MSPPSPWFPGFRRNDAFRPVSCRSLIRASDRESEAAAPAGAKQLILLTGTTRAAIFQGCEIGGSPPRYWTGGRAVECTSLENWRTRKGIESSNLSLSVMSSRRRCVTAALFIGKKARFFCSYV